MTSRFALTLSKAWPLQQFKLSFVFQGHQCSALAPGGLSAQGVCNEWTQSRRANAQAAEIGVEAPPQPLAEVQEMPGGTKSKGHEEVIFQFLDAARDHPGTAAPLGLLRSLRFLPRAPLQAHKPALVSAISAMLHSKHLEQPQATSEAHSSSSSSVEDVQVTAKAALGIEHVPKLLNSLSRAARHYPQIRNAVVKHERIRLKHLFEVAGAQTHLYADSTFVSSLATSQAMLGVYSRTFWKSLREEHVATWDARSAAAVIRAYSKLHSKHTFMEGVVAASATATEDSTTRLEDMHESTSDAPNQSSPDLMEEEQLHVNASGEIATEVPDAVATTETASSRQRIDRVTDTNLERVQQAALRMHGAEMHGNAVASSIASFSQQGLLHGESLEILQQGLQRTAATVKPMQLSLALWPFYRDGQGLGCAEQTVKDVMLKPKTSLTKMPLLHYVRTMRVVAGWGWNHDVRRKECLALISARARELHFTLSAQALGIISDFQAPVDGAHEPLLQTVLTECHRVTGASDASIAKSRRKELDGVADALQWLRQSPGDVSVDLVETVVAAVEAARSRAQQ